MKYEIISKKQDKHFKYRPSDFEDVIKLIRFCLNNKQKIEDYEITFFLAGKASTAEKLLESAEADKAAYWDKKNRTHKPIYVGTGVSGFVKKRIWVKR
tara:strand:+ start:2353 stop:2646 length:294 start_codon:yes stop_codon:yes gene_type:complete